MNKLFQLSTLLLLAGAAAGFTACAGEEDDLFSNSAAERLNMTKEKYTRLLTSNKAGWAILYYPTTQLSATLGEGYFWMTEFRNDGSVRVGMKNQFSDNFYREDTSPWEVITDNGPVLSFDSYNANIHAFSDPDMSSVPGVSGNQWGTGVGGDYEFVIVDAPADGSYVMLKGKKRSTYNLMIPLEEGTGFEAYLDDVENFRDSILSDKAPNPLTLAFGDKRYVMYDYATPTMSLYPEGGDAITETTYHPFMVYKRGNDYYFRLRDELSEGEDSVMQELKFDPVADKFISETNSNFFIEGYPAATFFSDYLAEAQTHRWQSIVSSDMSDKARAYMDALSTDFAKLKDRRNRSYTFNGISFGYNTRAKDYAWSIMYRVPGASSTTLASFKYDYAMDGSTANFTYVEPVESSDANVMNSIAAIPPMLEVLSQPFTVTPAGSSFNLTRIRITSVSDPDLWFVVSL